MAKLRYYYSTMNSGKSSHLLQANHNYRERGMDTMLFNAEINDRDGKNCVTSRIGISAPANTFAVETDLYYEVSKYLLDNSLDCILVDEAQFLTGSQVMQLAMVVDKLDIPVLAYGLRTDFLGNLFEGSQSLLAISDEIIEIKGVCFCGRKATMVCRVDSEGYAYSSGSQIAIGGEDMYVAVCRNHHTQALNHEIRLSKNLPIF